MNGIDLAGTNAIVTDGARRIGRAGASPRWPCSRECPFPTGAGFDFSASRRAIAFGNFAGILNIQIRAKIEHNGEDAEASLIPLDLRGIGSQRAHPVFKCDCPAASRATY